ncbi:hypothetical protein SCHPADRAFT_655326 [Schizopora paradoxa]|uniref:Uncharacterized protein n=1 Tax=Schizopora paradoxa TaxID=27342 RepID=A0A0H2R614_9AGAM|nr:hypothetical protein SCHPADRAFT_655326 [Schizopora paradoxa]
MDPSNSTYLTQDQIDEFQLQSKEMILASAFDLSLSIQPGINTSLSLLHDYLCCISNYAYEDRARASFEANKSRLENAWRQLRDKFDKERHDVVQLQSASGGGSSRYSYDARMKALTKMREGMRMIRTILIYLSERFLNVRVGDTTELPWFKEE